VQTQIHLLTYLETDRRIRHTIDVVPLVDGEVIVARDSDDGRHRHSGVSVSGYVCHRRVRQELHYHTDIVLDCCEHHWRLNTHTPIQTACNGELACRVSTVLTHNRSHQSSSFRAMNRWQSPITKNWQLNLQKSTNKYENTKINITRKLRARLARANNSLWHQAAWLITDRQTDRQKDKNRQHNQVTYWVFCLYKCGCKKCT